MTALFVYGTLLPGEVRWRFLAPFVTDEGVPDTVEGILYDTGLGYPAAVFGTGGRIVGRTFTLHPERVDEALSVLDDVEGAVAGRYGRVEVTTGAGRRVFAYAHGARPGATDGLDDTSGSSLGGTDLVPIAGGCWVSHVRDGDVSRT